MAASCFRFEVAEAADCTGDLADADILCGGVEAAEVAAHLGVPEQDSFMPKVVGSGVDAVGAADCRSVLELQGATHLSTSRRRRMPARMKRRSLNQGERLGGIDDVRWR